MKRIALIAAFALSLAVYGCSAAPGTNTGGTGANSGGSNSGGTNNGGGDPRFDTPPDTNAGSAPAGNWDGTWSSEAGPVEMVSAPDGKISGSWKDGTFEGQWATSATGVSKINYTWYWPDGKKGGSGWFELQDCDSCTGGKRLAGGYDMNGAPGGDWTLVRPK